MVMSWHEYSIYGMRVHADRPVPGLTPQPDQAPADVSIHLLGERPFLPLSEETEWVSGFNFSDPDGSAFQSWSVHRKDGVYLRLRYTGGHDHATFLIDPTGSHVWVNWTETATLEGLAPLLVGLVLGWVLRRRGVTCLHASAAMIGDRAIALVGHKGAGKSTTMAGLRQAGCVALTDDIAALVERDETRGRQTFLVHPGSPRLRLRSDAALGLHGSLEALQPLWTQPREQADQRYLDLPRTDDDLPRYPLPLAGIYVLETRSQEITMPSIASLPPIAGLAALLPHTYAGFLLDASGRSREFAFLSRLAATVPVRRVYRPDGLSSLPQICRAIMDDTTNRAGQACEMS